MSNGTMGEGGITYTVKELIGMLEKTIGDQLEKIVKRLDLIDGKLDAKASNSRVDEAEKRISKLEDRTSLLEIATAGAQAVSKFQRWAVGTVGVGCLAAIISLIWIAVGAHA